MLKTIKNITGAELKAFWSDDNTWGEDTFCEDLVFIIQGEEHLDMEQIYAKYGDDFENLPDTCRLDLESGWLMQGGIPKPGVVHDPQDLRIVFSDWRKQRDFVSFSATVDVKKDDPETMQRISRLMNELESLGVTVHRSDTANEKPSVGKPKL